MKEKQISATAFYNEFGEKLLGDFVIGNPRIEAALKFACNQLFKATPANILDLGFGLGWSSYEFSRIFRESEILGLDLSPNLKELAQRLFGDAKNLKFACQDLCDDVWLKQCKEKYDACVMLDVYEHVEKSKRRKFHGSLNRILSNDGILVLSCPTPMHQNYLRREDPEGLQPIDEDVTPEDLRVLAHDVSGEIAHFEYKSIWANNDYFHAVIARCVKRSEPTKLFGKTALLPVRDRLRRLSAVSDYFPPEVLASLRQSSPSVLQKIQNKFAKSFFKKS